MYLYNLFKRTTKWEENIRSRLLKQMTTSAVWFSHSDELRKHFWKQKVFWSSGYFVCSTGDASTETIAKYIAEQG